jgi:NAD(P)-dependent dehydrogenase (short-subunit alcohol dehydrogenase family)
MAAQNHKGKIALITGANKGIGYELARQLGKEGVTVLIAARNAELGDAAAGKLKADGTGDSPFPWPSRCNSAAWAS